MLIHSHVAPVFQRTLTHREGHMEEGEHWFRSCAFLWLSVVQYTDTNTCVMNTCPLHTHPWRSREERKESRKQHMKTDREGEREKDSLHTQISCGNACCSVIIYCCHPISSFLSYASGGMRRKRIVFLRRIEKQAREHLLHLLPRCVRSALACGIEVQWTKFEICTPDLPRGERTTAFSPAPSFLEGSQRLFGFLGGLNPI